MKIFTTQRTAYVFDFDDVLVKTNAKIKVYDDNELVKSLRSNEYAKYVKRKNETFDYNDFSDPAYIRNARVMPMFKVIININEAIKEARSDSAMYILSARPDILRQYIYDFLKANGISELQYDNVLTVGNVTAMSSADAKKKELTAILDKGYSIVFFDDDIKNISIAKELSNVKTRKIDDI